jgi:hypothetical protein
MPLPTHAFEIRGGCNCKAVRYRISVPILEERVDSPYNIGGKKIENLRLPMSVICHCNDCRAATAQIGTHAILGDVSRIEFAVAARSASGEDISKGEADRDWTPAGQLIDAKSPLLGDVWLSLYRSSPNRCRWFCGRCGTPVAYSADIESYPKGWETTPMVDIWTGTVDRDILERDWLKPDRSLWTATGIPWIREQIATGASGICEHPLTQVSKVMGDDIEADLEALKAIGVSVRVTMTK